MSTIEIKPDTRLEVEDILNGVSKLDTPDLEAFVEKVLALRAQRTVSGMPEEEAELLQKINRGLPANTANRLIFLNKKREETSLTNTELEELLAITEAIEQLNLERVQYLGVLANLKNVPVRELMQQLGIQPKPYA